MKIIYILVCIFYIWLSYNTFNTKTYGYVKFQFASIVLSISLLMSSIITFWYSNKYILLIPVLPFIYFINMNRYIHKKIHKKHKKRL